MKNNKKRKIAIFGPHDRFNYGDFLFPLMLEYAIEKLKPNTFEFEKFSLVKSDFTEFGAYRSKNYKSLKRNINSGKIDVLIVAGGECLVPTWHDLFGCISKKYVELYQKRNFRRVFKRINFAQNFLGGTSEYPYCVNKKDFKKSFCLIYNSVGSVLPYTNKHVEFLNYSDYLSVRDEMSYDNTKILDINTHLVPDSAIILSDIFPVLDLAKNSFIKNERIKELIKLKSKYVFFQISKYLTNNKIKDISDQLKNIFNKTNYKIVLCPIGIASGHEDNIPLNEIKQNYFSDALLIENPTIQEIMLLLANSSLYIGTSLHGVITSMSYGVPYIGLEGNTGKLSFYLKTWGNELLDKVFEVNSFEEQVYKILENKTFVNEIQSKTRIQKNMYYKSVNTFLDILK